MVEAPTLQPGTSRGSSTSLKAAEVMQGLALYPKELLVTPSPAPVLTEEASCD
jgi:hypothetical protein